MTTNKWEIPTQDSLEYDFGKGKFVPAREYIPPLQVIGHDWQGLDNEDAAQCSRCGNKLSYRQVRDLSEHQGGVSAFMQASKETECLAPNG